MFKKPNVLIFLHLGSDQDNRGLKKGLPRYLFCVLAVTLFIFWLFLVSSSSSSLAMSFSSSFWRYFGVNSGPDCRTITLKDIQIFKENIFKQCLFKIQQCTESNENMRIFKENISKQCFFYLIIFILPTCHYQADVRPLVLYSCESVRGHHSSSSH